MSDKDSVVVMKLKQQEARDIKNWIRLCESNYSLGLHIGDKTRIGFCLWLVCLTIIGFTVAILVPRGWEWVGSLFVFIGGELSDFYCRYKQKKHNQKIHQELVEMQEKLIKLLKLEEE